MAAATPPVYGCWRFGLRVPTYFTGTWAENDGRDLPAEEAANTNTGAAKNHSRRGAMIQRSKQTWSDCWH